MSDLIVNVGILHSLNVSTLAISAQFNLHQTLTFIHFAHFSIVFAIACLIAFLYGVLFSIWLVIEKATTFALSSGFLISLTFIETFQATFLESRFSIFVKFSLSLPKTKDAFVVKISIVIFSSFLEIFISPVGIQFNSFLRTSLIVLSVDI